MSGTDDNPPSITPPAPPAVHADFLPHGGYPSRVRVHLSDVVVGGGGCRWHLIGHSHPSVMLSGHYSWDHHFQATPLPLLIWTFHSCIYVYITVYWRVSIHVHRYMRVMCRYHHVFQGIYQNLLMYMHACVSVDLLLYVYAFFVWFLHVRMYIYNALYCIYLSNYMSVRPMGQYLALTAVWWAQVVYVAS